MDLGTFVEHLFRLDHHIDWLIQEYGHWTYGVLAGVVITPFLPGDSLLFAAGVFAARGGLDLPVLLVTLTAAAIVADNLCYVFGRYLGPRVLAAGLFSAENLARTHAFFERYGPVTIVLARYVAVVRTLAPLVAGVGAMDYRRYLSYSLLGAGIWVGSCTLAGYFLGNIPVVRDNFEYAVLVILGFTILGPAVEWARRRAGAAAAP